MKQFADDNFNFDENIRKFSKREENTAGKGKIASYEQFLLFPHCFQKACFPVASKGVNVWEWVKQVFMYFDIITFFSNMLDALHNYLLSMLVQLNLYQYFFADALTLKPDNRFLDWSKLKAFAYEKKKNVAEKRKQ